MKTLFALSALLLSSQAFAIAFITEAQVQSALHADKVIEISKYVAGDKLTERGSDCQRMTENRSARAYVVKKGYESILFVTTENLDDLKECGKL